MTTSLAPSLGKPLASESFTNNRFTLYYRQGRNPHPQFTFFDYPSKDMKLVVERAKRFCDQMSYRFVNVQPSVTDLDKEEAINRGDETR